MEPNVVISNGFQRYYLSAGAAELHKLGVLAGLITGAYPTKMTRSIINSVPALKNNYRLQRLLDREEKLPVEVVYNHNLIELLYLVATSLRRSPLIDGVIEHLRSMTFRQYGRSAAGNISRLAERGANIYHFRSGFGGTSADEAQKCGMVMLCDHTIAHPHVLQYMVENRGKMPPIGYKHPRSELFWEPVLEDIDRGQFYFVNSDFVKKTFVNQGIAPDRIYVVYQGVDDKFLRAISTNSRRDKKQDGPLALTFVGTFERRKGGPELVEALSQLNDVEWTLTIAGGINPDLREKYRDFFKDARVSYLGLLGRTDLIKVFSQSEVFVFPSRAEGSARVVFEAMACGCFVVTTPSSGSVVEDGKNGLLVEPGEPARLADAIRKAYSMRRDLAEIGNTNAKLVASKYRQSDFGDNLMSVYKDILRRTGKYR